MRRTSWRALGLVAGLALATGLGAGRAAAESDSCREWMGEHRAWKTAVVQRYLDGTPQRSLDEAVFELLQREAYLTSCEQSIALAREELVGWRLVGRLPDEYASAVLESLLERSGFDVSLESLFVGLPRPRIYREHAAGAR